MKAYCLDFVFIINIEMYVTYLVDKSAQTMTKAKKSIKSIKERIPRLYHEMKM